jgi:AbrB family looped-hinge helix DNA binding protein
MDSKVKGKKKDLKVVRARKVRAGRTSTSRISSKNQVTLPVDILRAIGLTAGDQVEFVMNENFIEVKPIQSSAQKQHKIMALAGDMTDYYEGFDLAAERASWDRV